MSSDFSEAPASSFDAFADAEEFASSVQDEVIHIRLQQRNGKKCLTTIQGLKLNNLVAGLKVNLSELAKANKKAMTEEDAGFEKLLKNFKRDFCCNGKVSIDEELGKVVQLQGDHRKKVSKYLIDSGFVTKEGLKIHGY